MKPYHIYLLALSIFLFTACHHSSNVAVPPPAAVTTVIPTTNYLVYEEVYYHYYPGYDSITHESTGTQRDTQSRSTGGYNLSLQIKPNVFVVYGPDTFSAYGAGQYINLKSIPSEKTILIWGDSLNIQQVSRSFNGPTGYISNIAATKIP